MKVWLTWLFSMAIYGAFFYWYTNLDGPLSEEEVERYLAVFEERDTEQAVRDRVEVFMRQDDGGEFIMVNLLQNGMPEDEAAEAMDNYMGFMWQQLLLRACVPVFMGEALAPVLDRVGLDPASSQPAAKDNPDHWDAVGLMRYRSRRDFIEIVAQDGFREAHPHKLKALTKTLAVPVKPVINPGDPRVLLGLLLFAICAIVSLVKGAGLKRDIRVLKRHMQDVGLS